MPVNPAEREKIRGKLKFGRRNVFFVYEFLPQAIFFLKIILQLTLTTNNSSIPTFLKLRNRDGLKFLSCNSYRCNDKRLRIFVCTFVLYDIT